MSMAYKKGELWHNRHGWGAVPFAVPFAVARTGAVEPVIHRCAHSLRDRGSKSQAVDFLFVSYEEEVGAGNDAGDFL